MFHDSSITAHYPMIVHTYLFPLDCMLIGVEYLLILGAALAFQVTRWTIGWSNPGHVSCLPSCSSTVCLATEGLCCSLGTPGSTTEILPRPWLKGSPSYINITLLDM